ncbi:hypothetical protein [Endozoicomonas lisbonensis]|uniref:Uncharacterized protein n=1 Tax=Endozoicomonas lisbonensis TaxID=3120522 RepID=A0ABV2SNY7_9GAMM
MWIKFNLDFRDNEASILSAINSLFALEQANEIDEEVIQRINPTFGLSDPNFKLKNPTFTAPIYNIDILFACINKSCNTRAMGFHFNRPDTSDLIEINDIVSILRKDYEFMGILLRLGPISATSGTIAVCKKGEIFKFFTHQFGETSVSSDLLNEFFEDLSRRAAMMNYKHACLFEVNALSPKFSSRRTASASGSGGTR